MAFAKTVIASFWKRVRKTEQCWLWIPKPSHPRNGYGRIYLGGGRENMRQESTHRFSWMLHYGAIPRGKFVLHSCDNGRCVRPDHLFLGTAKDNSQDMARKGRAYLQWAPRRVQLWAPRRVQLASAAHMRKKRVLSGWRVERGAKGRFVSRSA